jgi:hypothetical protein
MRVAVYDKKPGPGVGQWFLALTWAVGCALHKLIGKLDDYHAATSWDDAFRWLESRPEDLRSIQYWGHGSPGTVWLAQKKLDPLEFKRLIRKVTPRTILWFRTCSTFQGVRGYDISRYLSTLLHCTVAGHTRVIGFWQGGLHTRAPNQEPRWPVTEAELPSRRARIGLQRGNNTVICLAANVPEGW